jgi:hypothetical protein
MCFNARIAFCFWLETDKHFIHLSWLRKFSRKSYQVSFFALQRNGSIQGWAVHKPIMQSGIFRPPLSFFLITGAMEDFTGMEKRIEAEYFCGSPIF